MSLLHRDFNRPGQRHANRCVRLARSPVALRYPDGSPTGFQLSDRVQLEDGSCPAGAVRLDHHETIHAADGTKLYFHRGGNGYADAQNVKYGHLAASDLIDGPGSPQPAGNHRGAPAPGSGEHLKVSVRSIPLSMHYTRPQDTRRGSNRGARFMHYGDPAANQGDRHDIHYTYLLWSFVDVPGGGMVRALLAPGQAVEACDVRPRTAPSFDSSGERNGSVEAAYVRVPLEGGDLYGWTVRSHALDAEDERVLHLEPAAGAG
jgi:hypothetical protein